MLSQNRTISIYASHLQAAALVREIIIAGFLKTLLTKTQRLENERNQKEYPLTQIFLVDLCL